MIDKRYRWWPFVLMLVLIGATSGCGPGTSFSAKHSDLVGTYTVTYRSSRGVLGKEVLTLNANNTYDQEFTPAGKRLIRSSGTWRLENAGGKGKQSLVLEGFTRHVAWPYEHLAVQGKKIDVYSGVYRRSGAVVIPIDEDSDLYYRKVK